MTDTLPRFGATWSPKKTGWSAITKPGKMSELTFKRILLQRLSIVRPKRAKEPFGVWISKLAKEVGMTPAEADEWLFGALYRKDV